MSTITIHCDYHAEFGTKRSQVQNLSPCRTAVTRSFLRLLCDSWSAYIRGSFRIIQTGRQTQHILHSCQGLRSLITFVKRNFLVGYRADPPVSKSLSQFAGHRWRNKSQLAPASNSRGLRVRRPQRRRAGRRRCSRLTLIDPHQRLPGLQEV
jgi:hypothetical protein